MILQLERKKLVGSDEVLAVMRRAPQPPYPLHSHDFSELVVVTAGSGTHYTLHASTEIGPGDVFVLNGEQEHGYRNIDNLCLFNVVYDPGAVLPRESALRELPGYQLLFEVDPRLNVRKSLPVRLRLEAEELSEVVGCIEHMEQELLTRAAGYRDTAQAWFRIVVTQLSRLYGNLSKRQSGDVHYRLAQVIGMLESQYAEPCRVAELAARAGMAPSTFTRNFRQVTGKAPIDYVLELRLHRAATLLRQSHLNVTEIAHLVGFSDSNYFTRQFRRRYKQAPLRYRAAGGGAA